MKKSIFLVFAALTFALAACGGQAHAQTLAYQVKITPTKTADIFSAKIVNNTPGANSVTDQNGLVITGTFAYPTSVTATAFFQDSYAALPPGSQVYYNLTQVSSVECVGSQSVIRWIVGAPTYVSDGCAFSDNVKARSR